MDRKMNGFSIAGFILSIFILFIPLLGLIFSSIALYQIPRKNQRGIGLAIAGLIISILGTLFLIGTILYGVFVLHYF